MQRKQFIIDTSVIVDDPFHLVSLSQDGENDLFITDIILKEINGHKEDSLSDKGFFAREFIRGLDEGILQSQRIVLEKSRLKNKKGKHAKIIDTQKALNPINGDKLHAFKCIFPGHNEPIIINIINRDRYQPQNNINDLKILEIANDYRIELITNDITLKIMAMSAGLPASSIKKDTVTSPELIEFHREYKFNAKNKEALIQGILEKEKNWTQITMIEMDEKNEYETGKREFYVVNKNSLDPIFDEDDIKNFRVKPMNLEQKFYATMLAKNFSIFVVTGSTGSGKTLLALQEGMRRVKDKNDNIDGIIYMRNTVTSNDKASELGFRKGDENQKLGYFAYPLFGAINFILENTLAKNEKIDLREKSEIARGKTTKEDHTEEFMKEFNVEVMDIAHARGITISNKYIIFDELQNASNATMQLIGTRVGKGSIIVLMGDYRQVDHPYLTKNRNALVSLLKKGETDNMLAAIQLRNTIRSDIAKWFQENS